MDGGKKIRGQYKEPAGRSDRKSASGVSGDPKKGGRGGKFTWEGADGFTDEDIGYVGSNKAAGGAGAAAANNKVKSHGGDGASDE